MIKDMIGREIKVDDFVVFYSNIYRVKGLGKATPDGHGRVKLLIWNGGKTSKPVTKYSRDIALLPMADVLNWMLTKK